MDDREALTRAVAADPDDDLPRLVFADWLDEHYEAEYAAFVRTQIMLAAAPAWEPAAVRCRHEHGDEWVRGSPFRHNLPELPYGLEWSEDGAFRRGFAWSLVVRDMSTFLAAAANLFETAPVGRLHLPNGTLDDWRRLARQPWLPRVRSIQFYAMSPPTEAVRELCGSPLATGIEEIVFEASGSPAMPVVIERLMLSPLAQSLKRLQLRVGPDTVEAADELYTAIASGSATRLDSLSLITMSRGEGRFQDLCAAPISSRLREMEVANVPGVAIPSESGLPRTLLRLRAVNSHIRPYCLAVLTDSISAGLRSLDLSGNPLESLLTTDGKSYPATGGPALLKSLTLRKASLGDLSLERWLIRAAFWPKLVELDLRDNRITDDGARVLMCVPPPPDLTAIRLGGNRMSVKTSERLRDHFGNAAIFDVGEVGNGLR